MKLGGGFLKPFNPHSRETVRMQRMKENFYFHHLAGRTILEISKIYSLHKSSVYRVLGEIAQSEGVSRDSLLERPYNPYYREVAFSVKDRIDISNLLQDVENLSTQIDNLLVHINNTLQNLKEVKG